MPERTLPAQAVRVTVEFKPRVLVADISLRGWAVATAMEANLLMSLGKHRDAQQLIENEDPRELSGRLDTVGACARGCEVRNLLNSRAALPGPDAKPGLYVLAAAAADE